MRSRRHRCYSCSKSRCCSADVRLLKSRDCIGRQCGLRFGISRASQQIKPSFKNFSRISFSFSACFNPTTGETIMWLAESIRHGSPRMEVRQEAREAPSPVVPLRWIAKPGPVGVQQGFHWQASRTLDCQRGRAFGAIESTSTQSLGFIVKANGPALSEALGGSPSLRLARPSTRPSYWPEY